MVADTAGVAHAGGGNDDLGRLVRVEHLGFLQGLRKPQPGEGEHIHAALHQSQSLLIQIAPQIAAENSGGFAGQRGVDVHREVLNRFDQMLLLDAPQEVENLLGASHGESGNDDVAAPSQGPVDDLGQF